MSDPKTFKIKESISDIKKLMKSSHPMIAKRLHALLIFKQHEETGISKREVAEDIGVNHNSVQTWRNLYIGGGIEKLMSHSKTGYKHSLISTDQEKALNEQMHKPDNGFVGFIELLAWFNEKFKTDINYKTFHGFVVRKFNAKIKTARKVHVKKDPDAVEAFKKTSVRNVKKSSKTKAKDTKK
jgi:transposase